jgi:L-amino acid N-acyltransferase YncA
MELDLVCMADMDARDVLAIYEEGISGRQATFEASAQSWEQWDTAHLPECRFVAKSNGTILGWAALSRTSSRQCYAGVAEVSVYVRSGAHGQGIGRALLEKVIAESESSGFWTLQGSTFPENTASLKLQARCDFREIGRRERIAKLDGVMYCLFNLRHLRALTAALALLIVSPLNSWAYISSYLPLSGKELALRFPQRVLARVYHP